MPRQVSGVAFRLLAGWGLAAGVGASGQARTPLPAGAGCYTITDREACCLHTDGRTDDASYGGQDCVPSKPGVFFDHEDLVVCEPSCFVAGSCGDGGGQFAKAGVCSVEPTTPSPSEPSPSPAPLGQARTPVPDGAGCYAITDREACCLHTDGRTDDASYGGQDCVPSKPDVFFNHEDLVMCEPSCFVAGSCGDGGDQSVKAGVCSVEPSTPSPSVLAPSPVPAGTVEQSDARVPTGGQLRFYAIGSSNAAWQTWPDQLHVMLNQLGYVVDTPDLDVPGATSRPSRSPVCADAATYADLHTPRLGMVGWSTWGFAYDNKDDCDAEGFRQIAGHSVSCTNAWACNPKWTGRVPLVPISKLATGVRDAHFVVLANWINDGKTAQSTGAREACYKGAEISPMDTIAITEENLKRVIRAIHAENPDVVVLVLARYPDTKQVIYPNERTLPRVRAMNEAVKQKVQDEPNTFFVDLEFPLGENMFQTLSKVHPNCRGDKVMATTVVDALFKHKVLARGLDLSEDESCLANSDCPSLSLACCQRSALCYVADDGLCAAYGPGLQ